MTEKRPKRRAKRRSRVSWPLCETVMVEFRRIREMIWVEVMVV